MVPTKDDFAGWARVQTWLALVALIVVGGVTVLDILASAVGLGIDRPDRTVAYVVGFCLVITVVLVWYASRLGNESE